VNHVYIASVIKVQSKKQGQEDTFYSNINSLIGTEAS